MSKQPDLPIGKPTQFDRFVRVDHQTLRAGSRTENSSLTERRTASVREPSPFRMFSYTADKPESFFLEGFFIFLNFSTSERSEGTTPSFRPTCSIPKRPHRSSL